jgi:2-succinyl-6-hydroxy-2,4-cyclohexadiene-1-carboxylate synthase
MDCLSYFAAVHGVRIHARVHERAGTDRPPVVILHGFTGCSESMQGVASVFEGDRTTISVDLVGHGCSDAPDDPQHYSMQRCVDQLRALLDAMGPVRPHLLGYSMGGRVALSFCALYPEDMLSALLIGASPGLANDADRIARVQADEALADRIAEQGLEAFVDEWMAKPIFASQARLGEEALAAARNQRLRNRPHGLAQSLRGMGTGAMPPIELSGVKVPLCFVAGEEDEKFSALARELAARIPAAACEIVASAGHAAHLESPEAFGRIARSFFDRVDRESNAPAKSEAGRG